MSKIQKLLSALVLSAIVIGGFAGCSTSKSNDDKNISSIDKIKKRGTIRIGVFGDKAPLDI